MKSHGESKTKLYYRYKAIKSRCNNPNNPRYKDYGGRGISVCEEWSNNYLAFKKWCLNNGYKEELQIDRINNDGNYEPSNCRWVDRELQMRNTRRIRANNKSGYRGVSYSSSKKKYVAVIYIGGKRIEIGMSKCKIECAKMYDDYILGNNLKHTTNGLNIDTLEYRTDNVMHCEYTKETK